LALKRLGTPGASEDVQPYVNGRWATTEVEKIVTDLKASREGANPSAVHALIPFGSAAVPRLVGLLNDPHEWVRYNACLALLTLAENRKLNPTAAHNVDMILDSKSSDPSHLVREEAKDALHEIKTDEAKGSLASD